MPLFYLTGYNTVVYKTIMKEHHGRAFVKRHNGPKRKIEDSFFDDFVTTSDSIKFHVDKSIVRTPRPSDFNSWLTQYASPREVNKNVSLDIVNRLATHRKWTSSTAVAMQESALPTPRKLNVPGTTTQEMHPDPVRLSHRLLHNIPHSDSPMLWQQLGRKWDSVQSRGSYAPGRMDYNEVPLAGCYCKSKEKIPPYLFREANKDRKSLFIRQVPAYRGYIPRLPIPVSSEDTEDNCSTSRWSFRKFPSYEYGNLSHCRNGCFSKAIVLIPPHNPFNKIDPYTKPLN